VIIAPGGAFVALAISLEGADAARWLQQHGIAAFVLKYRTVEKKQDGIPQMDMDTAGRYGIADGIQALRVVRQHAAEWGIAADRVGMLGFSAGGMVTSGALLQADTAARPSFAAMIYGAPFGVMPPIPAKLPPVFLAWAQDDPVAREPVVRFRDALLAAGIKPEVHVFSAGGHGFGMRKQGTSSDHWIDIFYDWLDAQGFTRRAARPTPAAQPASDPAPDPVPPHDTLTVVSHALGEPRRINVHTPAGYGAARAARFPVLYMPDGGIDEDFPHVVNTVDSLIALGRIRPVIVVGVPNTERRRDLTGPTREARDSAIAPHVGGSAAFRRFLRDELVPTIDARYRTTRERGIVGESLAGLFVVETLLTDPSLFTHYVAFDPSLWWDRGALADSAAARLGRLDVRGRTLFMASSRDGIDDRTARLAAALRAARSDGLALTYVPRSDLTHATIFRAAGPAALVTALR
jgi:predicted alpha/beta superfamily hydrolase